MSSLLAVPLLAALGLGPVIDWVAPEQCPPTSFILDELEALLGASAHTYTHSRLRAVVRVSQAQAGWRAELEVFEGYGPKISHFEDADCRSLSFEIAAVLAMEISPFITTISAGEGPDMDAPVVQFPRTQPASPVLLVAEMRMDSGPTQEQGPNIEGGSGADTEAENEARSSDRTLEAHALIGAGALGVVNLFPNVGTGPSLHVGVGFERARLQLVGSLPHGGRYFIDNNRRAGMELLGWQLGLGACGLPLAGGLELQLCGIVGGGGARGEGFGDLATTQILWLPWWWTRGEVNLAWLVHPKLALYFGLGVQFALAPPTFEITGTSSEWKIPIAQGYGQVGFEFRLGQG